MTTVATTNSAASDGKAVRLTPSCSRCRQKKLRCNGETPCNQCTSKGIEECWKDQALPRGRKRPRVDADTKRMLEIQSLKKRLAELDSEGPLSPSKSPEGSQDGGAQHQSHNELRTGRHTDSLQEIQLESSGSNDHSEPPRRPMSASKRPSGSWSGRSSPTPEVEDAAHILEQFALSTHPAQLSASSSQGLRLTAQSMISSQTSIPQDRLSRYWSDPSRYQQRLALVRKAKESLPETSVVEELLRTFFLRAHHFVGHAIFRPALLRSTRRFMLLSSEALGTSPYFEDPSCLAVALLAISLGLRFYPVNAKVTPGAGIPAEYAEVDALRQAQPNLCEQWHAIAKECLAVEHTYRLTSLSALQATCLLILIGQDDEDYMRFILSVSIQSAQSMNLHRLGECVEMDERRVAMPNPPGSDKAAWEAGAGTHRDGESRWQAKVQAAIRRETGVRIWWYLVVKDWCTSQAYNSTYAIHPGQVSTRKPLHISDEDLGAGLMTSRPMSEWTEMSYVLVQIHLAEIVRLSGDLRNQSLAVGFSPRSMASFNVRLLDRDYHRFLTDLPEHYKIKDFDAQDADPPIVIVQRTLIHIQVFDLSLKLHRSSLASAEGRRACMPLALKLVHALQYARKICPIIDGFRLNRLHLTSACLVILFDLLLGESGRHSDHAEHRQSALTVVKDALVSLRNGPGTASAVHIIEKLLEAESALARRQQTRGIGDNERARELLSLSEEIVSRAPNGPPPKDASTCSSPLSDARILPALTNCSSSESDRSTPPSAVTPPRSTAAPPTTITYETRHVPNVMPAFDGHKVMSSDRTGGSAPMPIIPTSRPFDGDWRGNQMPQTDSTMPWPSQPHWATVLAHQISPAQHSQQQGDVHLPHAPHHPSQQLLVDQSMHHSAALLPYAAHTAMSRPGVPFQQQQHGASHPPESALAAAAPGPYGPFTPVVNAQDTLSWLFEEAAASFV